MAEATEELVNLTWWQIWATAIEVALVLIAVFTAIYAACVARRALGEAIRQNTLNREALIASERAWIKIEDVQVTSELEWREWEGSPNAAGRVSVEIHVSNVGKSIAHNVWIMCNIVRQESVDGDVEYTRFADSDRYGPPPAHWGYIIFPNDPFVQSMDITITKAVFPPDARPLRLVLICVITYRLVFAGEVRQTGFAYPIQWLAEQGRIRKMGPEFGDIPAQELRLNRSFGSEFAD